MKALVHRLVFAFAIGTLSLPVHSQDDLEQEMKQIVILYTHRPTAPICADWDRGIRTSLEAGIDEPVDIEIEYLNLSRFSSEDYLNSWIELLKAKYTNNPPDLIIPVFAPALQFTLEHRASLFPDVPIVFCSAPSEFAERAHAGRNVTGVAYRLDVAGTLSAMAHLQPRIQRLIVLSGSPIDKAAWRISASKAMPELDGKIELDFVEGLPLPQLMERVKSAPPNTSILMLSYNEDAEGGHYMTTEIADQLAAHCSLPIYGLYDSLLGHGIVGGSLASVELQGRLAGDLAVRVLNGERPEEIDIVGLGGVRPTFDARELRRCGLPEADLPANSVILNREPTFWDEFGDYLIFGFAALFLQSLIIVALLVNRARRLHAESEAQHFAGQILTAQEDERRYIAREMHDDLSQRLAASAIVAGNLERELHSSPASCDAMSGLKGSLIAICDDMHRLSRKIHPAILDDFGLTEALRAECDSMRERDCVDVDFRCGDVPDNLPNQIALCLYRIAQEALWNSSKYSCSDRVMIELNSDAESIYLEIRDYGVGFNSEEVSAHQSIGIASMKERTRLVRGTITIDSADGEGASVLVRVPLPERVA